MYCAFADDENANGMGGNFVLAQEVGHKGGAVATTIIGFDTFPDDFNGRLRQIELLPSLASNNRRSREVVEAKVELLQARHASCSSCPAYARPVIRSKIVEAEVELGHCREMRQGAAKVRSSRRMKLGVAKVEAGQGREMRECGTEQSSTGRGDSRALKVQACDARVERQRTREDPATSLTEV